MTQPFACGTAFAVSVLDSLMSTVCISLSHLASYLQLCLFTALGRTSSERSYKLQSRQHISDSYFRASSRVKTHLYSTISCM